MRTISITFSCKLCEYSTKFRSNLTKHSKIHEKGISCCTLRCPSGNCVSTFRTLNEVDKYMNISHKISIDVEDLVFKDEEKFKAWRDGLRKKS